MKLIKKVENTPNGAPYSVTYVIGEINPITNDIEKVLRAYMYYIKDNENTNDADYDEKAKRWFELYNEDSIINETNEVLRENIVLIGGKLEKLNLLKITKKIIDFKTENVLFMHSIEINLGNELKHYEIAWDDEKINYDVINKKYDELCNVSYSNNNNFTITTLL